jgi:hypothetical protein
MYNHTYSGSFKRSGETIQLIQVPCRHAVIERHIQPPEELRGRYPKLCVDQTTQFCQHIEALETTDELTGTTYLMPMHCLAPFENVTKCFSSCLESSSTHLSGLKFCASGPHISTAWCIVVADIPTMVCNIFSFAQSLSGACAHPSRNNMAIDNKRRRTGLWRWDNPRQPPLNR